LKTHTPDPAVFAIYDSRNASAGAGGRENLAPTSKSKGGFNEKEAIQTGDLVKVGHHLMKQFLQ
jgi:hypothetical protein